MTNERIEIDRIIDEVADQSELLDVAIAALQGKAAGGESDGGGLPDGIAAIATGTITPASDTSALTITHNLGVKPDFAVLMLDKDAGSTAEANMTLWSALFHRPVTLPTGTAYQSLGFRHSTGSTGSLTGTQSNDSTGKAYPVTETTLKIPTSILKAGYTYRWACVAFD